MNAYKYTFSKMTQGLKFILLSKESSQLSIGHNRHKQIPLLLNSSWISTRPVNLHLMGKLNFYHQTFLFLLV
jgi:hypothetical protein